MQILTIGGSNLASLSKPFEIDLTQEPLRSTGLFAITGETGAGKSTILDAMCLALYGNCPRLSGVGVNDDVPDVTGETIKSSDPRAILRRGASQGFAEVTFLAPDGFRYKATWAARRARGRSEGRLQNVERSLTRLDDDQILESQIKAVTQKVTEITGLTYDEFRRTVLLAQGDFDAFLRANTPERAALLEKVTGTQIYRTISKRIYARHEEAQSALSLLETQRAATPVLSDEDRLALKDESELLIGEIKALKVSLEEITQKIRRHEAVSKAQKQVEDAQAKEREASAMVQEAAPQRAHLKKLEMALSLRSEYSRMLAAQKAISKLKEDETVALNEQGQLLQSLEIGQKENDEAVKNHENAESLFKELGPIWTDAARLDNLILSAEEEVKKATDLHARISDQKQKQASELTVLNQEQQKNNDMLEAACAQLSRAPDTDLLADRWEELDRLIQERSNIRNAGNKARLAATEAQKLSVKLQFDLIKIDKDGELDRKSIFDLETGIETARSTLRGISKNDPQHRLNRLLEGSQAIKDMRRATQEFCSAKDTLLRATNDQAKARQMIEAARILIQASDQKILTLTATVEALQSPVDLAEVAVSEQAAHLRQHLQAGDPCPVCGSEEHPVQDDEALISIARTLRKNLQEARANLAEQQRKQVEGQRAVDTQNLVIEAANETRTQAFKAIESATKAFDIARKTALEARLTQVPELSVEALVVLDELQDKVNVRREEITALIVQQSELRLFVERESDRVRQIGLTIDDRSKQREQITARSADEQARASLKDQEATHANERVAQIDRNLTAPLAAANQTTDALEQDSDEVRKALKNNVRWWRQQTAAKDQAEKGLKEIAPMIAAANADQNGLVIQLSDADTDLKVRQQHMAALKSERSKLLGGEQTDAHRTRHNDARLSANAQRTQTAVALSELKSQKSGVDARLQTCRDALGPAGDEAKMAQEDLEQKLIAAELDRDALDVLLTQGPAEASSLRERLKTIDDTLTGTISNLKERQADLQGLLDKGLPIETETDLLTSKVTQEALRDQKAERNGSIHGQILSDDQLRQTQKDLDGMIKASKAVYDTWAAVNGAVGSKQGGKFAQIAQSVTLSMLVERANQHLADLKPRYQLAQGGDDLALHIIDKDMGNEVRSTRSLSGGERFLVSLSLALALSGMGSRGGLAETLFIDEGFGSLDAESLDVAMDALETLQAQGRTIGVISHVDAMKDRIPVQLRVTRHGSGASSVELITAA